MPKLIENINVTESEKIRRHFDEKVQKWYFSVADVMGIVTDSTDARNYWKVLKNRIKKASPELVTKCNQLKMMSRDGKFYLTDVADAETIIEILKSVPKIDVEHIKTWFEPFVPNLEHPINEEVSPLHHEQAKEEEARLLVDVYQTRDHVFIEAMVAGLSLPELKISVTKNKVKIDGERQVPKEKINSEDYFCQELYWVSFGRTILLPSPVDPENFDAREDRGHLKIKLRKLTS